MRSDPDAANKVLEKYLKNNYDYQLIRELAGNYFTDGRSDDAVELLEDAYKMADYDLDVYSNIVNIYSRTSEYDKAIDASEKIIKSRPSDYSTLADLGLLNRMKGNDDKALEYYEEALRFFPFSLENNEKIRELKGQTSCFDLVENTPPEDVIAAYERDFTPTIKKMYDIVADDHATIIFNSKATAKVQKYILRMNDEDAIRKWQQWQLGTSNRNMQLTINEAQTIKHNGNKIDAERHGSNVVFTNLEVGDYIYVFYTEKQVRGGKSSLFISDKFNLNSFYPTFKKQYTLFAEKGLDVVYELINTQQETRCFRNRGI